MTQAAGLGDQHGKTLGALFADYDGDLWPDLYLGNDAVAGDLYHNERGRFRNLGATSGTAYKESGQVQSAMGVDFADYNGDGRPDLAVTTFQNEPTSLYANRGASRFDLVTEAAGLGAASRQALGFGARLADFDNDGWVDLAVANGHVVDQQEKIDRFTNYRQPLQLFRNQGGAAFTDATSQAGPGFTTPAVGRGLATGDLNRDGRLDLLAVDLEGPPRLLWNQSGGGNRWVGFRLTGQRSNRLGLGAQVKVEAGGRTWVGECRTGGSYFSASSPVVHFGLGGASGTARVTVRWPGGNVATLPSVPLDHYHTVDEARGLLPE